MIRDITRSKVSDTTRYDNVGSKDPTPPLKKELHSKWLDGCSKGYVTCKQARDTVGLIVKDDKVTVSTSDNVKHSTPYGYPNLKVHKLTKEEIMSKKVPPSRFVTDLSNGLTARSDKFIVWKWLGNLTKDYAVDLVKDSTGALMKLDEVEKSGTITDNDFWSFSMDVVSLYDSLSYDVVMDAINGAVSICRPSWDVDFKSWLLNLIMLSFRSAVVYFEGNWYVGKRGVPTGGIPSVDCGNISVFYVFIYSPTGAVPRPIDIIYFIRFVDDGSGVTSDSRENFILWFDQFKQLSVSEYGLDWTYEINPINSFTNFLDINFKFDAGSLTTDVYRKPTDANRYLEFTSYHPRHTFESIVYSQAIRYRRIINNDEILDQRLDELNSFFTKSSYPVEKVDHVIDKVKSLPRNLEYTNKDRVTTNMTPWITTYGQGFDEAKIQAREANEMLMNSKTWKDEDPNIVPQIKVIPRRAPNLKDILFRRKAIALESGVRATVPCTNPGEKKRGAKCQCCKLVSGRTVISNNWRSVKSAGGNCKSSSIIYGATCKICEHNRLYTGKSVNSLRDRVNGHRSKYYELARAAKASNSFFINLDEIDDDSILGAHLVAVHNKADINDFNECYYFDILTFANPENLRIKEQFYINKLKTLSPFGLNQVNSVTGL